MKKITLSKYAGFCQGVKRALDITNRVIQSGEKPLYMLGCLVHNEEVIRELDEKDIQIISDFKDIDRGTLIITAHGTGPKVKEQALKQKLKVIDATCPQVIKIYQIVKRFKNKGWQIIIVGDKEHIEVKGIQAWAGRKAIIISKPQEAQETIINPKRKAGLVSQSTQDVDNLEKIVAILQSQRPDIEIHKTICQATRQRQSSVKKLAKKNQLIVVIGSKTSANTKRLYEISKKINPQTYFVSTVAGLKPDWFEDITQIGVTAGASTPDRTIKEVIEKIRKF